MESRGGVTGGPTMTDFLTGYAEAGFTGSFFPVADGRLQCCSCGRTSAASDVRLLGMRRYEGASEPDEMGAVAALQCPQCGARGTTTFAVGVHTPPEEGAILRALNNQRHSSHASWESMGTDHSLVRDTGWLKRPADD